MTVDGNARRCGYFVKVASRCKTSARRDRVIAVVGKDQAPIAATDRLSVAPDRNSGLFVAVHVDSSER